MSHRSQFQHTNNKSFTCEHSPHIIHTSFTVCNNRAAIHFKGTIDRL